MNVYQKLILARERFLARNVKKSGINRQLEFQYFELQDIVPAATRIFKNIGLLGIVQFPPVRTSGDGTPITEPVATMTIINTENPTETVEFTIPYREVEQIRSKSGNTVTNPLQALGSSVTYLRRYLWMLALDIVEQDDVDATLGAKTTSEKPTTPAPKSTAPSPAQTVRESASAATRSTAAKPEKPATPAERESIKVALVQADEPADELMVRGLKDALKILRQKDESKEKFILELSEKTVGFTKLSRRKCEELVNLVRGMIAEYDTK